MTDQTTNDEYFDDDLSKVIYLLFNRLSKTNEFRNAFFTVALEILHLWAGESSIKKRIAQSIKKSLRKGFLRSQPEREEPYLALLFNDPNFIKLFGKFVPRLIDNLINTAASIAGGIETLPIKDKEQLFSRPISETDMGRSGQFVTSVFRIVNEIHKENTVFYADKFHLAFRAFIQNVDLGEIKEAVDRSSDDIAEAIRSCNNEIWNYPAKVVSIFALIPSLLKIAAMTAEDTVKRFNNIAPDLLTDIVLSLMRELDIKTIGALGNQLAELMRKLHTGSALLGEAGEPRFSTDLRTMAQELLSTLDADLLLGAQNYFRDGKQTVSNTFLALLQSRPELVKQRIENRAESANRRVALGHAELSLLEELDDETFGHTATQGTSQMDIQAVAEIVNLTSTLVNRVSDLKPELLPSLATQLADSLDLYEVQESTRNLANGLGDSLKPLGRAVLPSVIKGVCEALAPDDDEYEDEVEQARFALRDLLLGKEVSI